MIATYFTVGTGRLTGKRVAVPIDVAEEVRRTLVGHASPEADAVGVTEFFSSTRFGFIDVTIAIVIQAIADFLTLGKCVAGQQCTVYAEASPGITIHFALFLCALIHQPVFVIIDAIASLLRGV